MTEPRVKAKHLQLWLQLIDGLDAARAERFRAAVKPESLAAIASAAPLGWLPIAIDVEMAEALVTALGPVGAHELYAAMYRAGREASLLAKLAVTAEKLLGASPATFAKWLPRAWEALFKECGAVRAEVIEEERAVLVYEGIPAECTRSAAWVDSLSSGMDPVFASTGTTGVVHADTSAIAEGRIRFTLSWSRAHDPVR